MTKNDEHQEESVDPGFEYKTEIGGIEELEEELEEEVNMGSREIIEREFDEEIKRVSDTVNELKKEMEDIIQENHYLDEETTKFVHSSAQNIAKLGYAAWKSDGETDNLRLNKVVQNEFGNMVGPLETNSIMNALEFHGLVDTEPHFAGDRYETGSSETVLDPDTPYEKKVVSGKDEIDDPTEAFLRLGVIQARETDTMDSYDASMLLGEYLDSQDPEGLESYTQSLDPLEADTTSLDSYEEDIL